MGTMTSSASHPPHSPRSPQPTHLPQSPRESHTVTVLTRPGCGSCVRVTEQITPMLSRLGVPLIVVDVEDNADPDAAELRIEFGDRLPVVLLDGEEFACWEVDTTELESALRA